MEPLLESLIEGFYGLHKYETTDQTELGEWCPGKSRRKPTDTNRGRTAIYGCGNGESWSGTIWYDQGDGNLEAWISTKQRLRCWATTTSMQVHSSCWRPLTAFDTVVGDLRIGSLGISSSSIFIREGRLLFKLNIGLRKNFLVSTPATLVFCSTKAPVSSIGSRYSFTWSSLVQVARMILGSRMVIGSEISAATLRFCGVVARLGESSLLYLLCKFVAFILLFCKT